MYINKYNRTDYVGNIKIDLDESIHADFSIHIIAPMNKSGLLRQFRITIRSRMCACVRNILLVYGGSYCFALSSSFILGGDGNEYFSFVFAAIHYAGKYDTYAMA